jgi:mannose-1-phosphate guanylyltransferase
MYSIIIAGGIGKRFWPRSRRERPKQFLNIIGDSSMLQMTYERLKVVSDEKKIFIVAGQNMKEGILKTLKGFPEKNIICEPSGKNTAPAIGLASAMIVNKDPEAVIGIFPADHYIKNISEFEKSVEEGFRYARDHTALITFGIKPERPATGYGYIQFDKNVRISDGAIYKVKTFAEKPNQATAQRFIESGEFLWNSGMFIWKGINILNAIKIYLPELYECLSAITAAIDSPEFETILKHQWTMIHSISIDYGILEKAKNVYVVSGNFDWSDVGSWDAVYDLKPKDANGNVLIGDVQTIDTNGCYFYSRRNLITAIGVSNLIVVQSKDSILIVNRGESEKVKDLVEMLGRDRFADHL